MDSEPAKPSWKSIRRTSPSRGSRENLLAEEGPGGVSHADEHLGRIRAMVMRQPPNWAGAHEVLEEMKRHLYGLEGVQEWLPVTPIARHPDLKGIAKKLENVGVVIFEDLLNIELADKIGSFHPKVRARICSVAAEVESMIFVRGEDAEVARGAARQAYDPLDQS